MVGQDNGGFPIFTFIDTGNEGKGVKLYPCGRQNGPEGQAGPGVVCEDEKVDCGTLEELVELYKAEHG